MYIAIEGVIGVGKTSLASFLQTPFDSNILLEIFEENPFLSKFYEDRERYAFQTQMFFLIEPLLPAAPGRAAPARREATADQRLYL